MSTCERLVQQQQDLAQRLDDINAALSLFHPQPLPPPSAAAPPSTPVLGSVSSVSLGHEGHELQERVARRLDDIMAAVVKPQTLAPTPAPLSTSTDGTRAGFGMDL